MRARIPTRSFAASYTLMPAAGRSHPGCRFAPRSAHPSHTLVSLLLAHVIEGLRERVDQVVVRVLRKAGELGVCNALKLSHFTAVKLSHPGQILSSVLF